MNGIHFKITFVLLACAALTMLTLSPGGAAYRPLPAKARRILFTGNSLTYTNDLPAVVERLAALEKEKVQCQAVAYANFSLEDHWHRGEALRAITGSKWDVVVLQQGPSASPEGRKVLIEYTRRFAGEINRTGAKTALFMVWPAAARIKDFDNSIESYRLAAQEVNAMVWPVGAAFKLAQGEDAGLKLYTADGFHPSETGTYLAALVIFEKLFGRLPASSDPSRAAGSATLQITAAQQEILMRSSAQANRQY